MNIEITRKEEVIVTPKVAVAPIILTPEQLDGMVQLIIEQGNMSATERIGSHNLECLIITATQVQSADEDASHTVFKPAFQVDITLK